MENAKQIIDVSDIIMYKVSSFLLIFIFMNPRRSNNLRYITQYQTVKFFIARRT